MFLMKGRAFLLWLRAFWQPGTSQQISKEDEGRARDEKKKTEKNWVVSRLFHFSTWDQEKPWSLFLIEYWGDFNFDWTRRKQFSMLTHDLNLKVIHMFWSEQLMQEKKRKKTKIP